MYPGDTAKRHRRGVDYDSDKHERISLNIKLIVTNMMKNYESTSWLYVRHLKVNSSQFNNFALKIHRAGFFGRYLYTLGRL